jgi:hypothetical protein
VTTLGHVQTKVSKNTGRGEGENRVDMQRETDVPRESECQN